MRILLALLLIFNFAYCVKEKSTKEKIMQTNKNLQVYANQKDELNEKIKKSFAPITYARGTFIGMLHKDIVSLLGIQNIENVYFVGKVYDVNKTVSKEYISVVPKFRIYIRGGKESTCNICEKCGVVLYFPLPLNSWYIVDKSIPNLTFFPSALTGIIVNDEILKQIKKSGIKRIGYEKLPVLKEAIDGHNSCFGALPPE